MPKKIPLARGHRSMVYLVKKRGKTYVMKEERRDITAINRIRNEVNWLKILNKKGVGPKLIEGGPNYFICQYVKGDPIIKWTEKNTKAKIQKMLVNVLNQCFEMDKLKINKMEMNHPYKHIIVDKKPIMIDFERVKKTLTPKNITQFCQFLTSTRYYKILKDKKFNFEKEKLLELAKKYKRTYSKRDFNKIVNHLK